MTGLPKKLQVRRGRSPGKGGGGWQIQTREVRVGLQGHPDLSQALKNGAGGEHVTHLRGELQAEGRAKLERASMSQEWPEGWRAKGRAERGEGQMVQASRANIRVRL